MRDLKDAMNLEILTGFDAAGIGIASATYGVVGFPALRFQNAPSAAPAAHLPAWQQTPTAND